MKIFIMRHLLFYLLGTLAALVCLYFFYSPVYKLAVKEVGIFQPQDKTMIQKDGKFISPRQLRAVTGDEDA